MAYDEYVMRTFYLMFHIHGTVEVNIFEIGRHIINTLCMQREQYFSTLKTLTHISSLLYIS